MRYDIFGLGNPLIDIILHVEDRFMAQLRLEKGSMNLVDTVRQKEILDKAAGNPKTTTLGGSCANTMVMAAQLGAKVAYGGKIGNDDLGIDYEHQLIRSGVDSYLAKGAGVTGSTIILVNPDAERTMNTHLGMCTSFSKDDLCPDGIRDSHYLYVTGYLWDTPVQQEAVIAALEIAKSANVRIAFSLSDFFCVERHKDKFQLLIDDYVDILFCNEQEAGFMTGENLAEKQLQKLSESVSHVVLTMGKKGSMIQSQGRATQIDPIPIEAVDTTGAGDSYAAGYLYGITQGYDIKKSGRLGAFCAATIVSQIGPRYQGDLRELAKDFL